MNEGETKRMIRPGDQLTRDPRWRALILAPIRDLALLSAGEEFKDDLLVAAVEARPSVVFGG